MHLFNYGDSTLHSGAKSSFKIDCDALTDEDIEAIAKMLVEILPPFGNVEGIPTGGLRLAEALKPYCKGEGQYGVVDWLIVDDVATTGGSIHRAIVAKSEESNWQRSVIGAVIFNRQPFRTNSVYHALFEVNL